MGGITQMEQRLNDRLERQEKVIKRLLGLLLHAPSSPLTAQHVRELMQMLK